MPRPYIKNVDGDFYVEDGCCITCAIPLDIAPVIFDMDDAHCFVKKQPATPEELRQALEAIQCAEIECIRYKGKDHRILQRLVEAGQTAICDDSDAGFYKEQHRNHITFTHKDPHLSQDQICNLLVEYLKSQKNYHGKPSYTIKYLETTQTTASIALAWYEQNFHEVRFSMTGQACLVHLHPSPPNLIHGLARLLYDWLRHNSDIQNLCFMTGDEFMSGSGGQAAPY